MTLLKVHCQLMLMMIYPPVHDVPQDLASFVTFDIFQFQFSLQDETLAVQPTQNAYCKFKIPSLTVLFRTFFYNTVKHFHICCHFSHLIAQSSTLSSLLIQYITALPSFLTLRTPYCESLHITPGCDDDPPSVTQGHLRLQWFSMHKLVIFCITVAQEILTITCKNKKRNKDSFEVSKQFELYLILITYESHQLPLVKKYLQASRSNITL